jgi:hypothetical protein
MTFPPGQQFITDSSFSVLLYVALLVKPLSASSSSLTIAYSSDRNRRAPKNQEKKRRKDGKRQSLPRMGADDCSFLLAVEFS